MNILKFNRENTKSHMLKFINEIKNGLSAPTIVEAPISTINWHEILNAAAKNSGSLRTKGSHTRNWKNKNATSSAVTGLRRLHNLILQEQQEKFGLKFSITGVSLKYFPITYGYFGIRNR